MISIIICSVNKFLLSQVKLNIEETIGIPYEIIAIDNAVNKEGICTVYNKAGSMAQFPILCFVHEDVSFETKNWGLLVEQHLADSKIGLIGLAGGDTKGIVPSSWSSSFISNEINIYQHYKSGSKPHQHILTTAGGGVKMQKEVVALDGVFLCTRKEIFDRIKFDEINFKGFHGYDIDYSLQILKEFKVAVVFDILLHHYSEGKPDGNWLKSAFIISKKWRSSLPVSAYNLSDKEFNLHHWQILQVFLSHLFRLQYRFDKILFYYLSFSFTRFFTIRRFLSMGKYVLQYFYKKRLGEYNKSNHTIHSGKMAIETGHHKNIQ
jgi:hypothetical protein